MATADQTRREVAVQKLRIPAVSVVFVLSIGLAMLAMKNLSLILSSPPSTMAQWMLSWCVMLVGFGVALWALYTIDREWKEGEE